MVWLCVISTLQLQLASCYNVFGIQHCNKRNSIVTIVINHKMFQNHGFKYALSDAQAKENSRNKKKRLHKKRNSAFWVQ